MSQRRGRMIALVAGGLLAGGGCAKTPPAPLPRPQPVTTRSVADPMERIQTLSRLAEELARTSNVLPGGDAATHRQLMAQAFSQLDQILPILDGPTPGAEFRQQLLVVRDSHNALADGPQNLIADPIIDLGVRASRDALAGITQRGYYDQGALKPIFERLSAKTNELDTSAGPLHQIIAGDCVTLLSQIVTGMSKTFTSHGADSAPATAPATSPAAGQ